MKYMPTWKWWTASVTGAGTIIGVAVTGDGINTDDEKLLVVGFIVQRIVAYLTPNSEAPVPPVV